MENDEKVQDYDLIGIPRISLFQSSAGDILYFDCSFDYFYAISCILAIWPRSSGLTIRICGCMTWRMEHLAMQFKALSEPVRLRILNLLMSGELCVCDLMDILGLPQSTVSRHLAYLRNAGWVRGKRVGVWMHYLIAGELDALQKRVLEALSLRFSELPEVGADIEALKRHMKTKSEDRCEQV